MLLRDRNCPTDHMLMCTITSRDMSACRDNTSKHTESQTLLLSRLLVMLRENSQFFDRNCHKMVLSPVDLARQPCTLRKDDIANAHTHTHTQKLPLQPRVMGAGERSLLDRNGPFRNAEVRAASPTARRPRAKGRVSGNRDKEHISSTKLSFSHL